MEPADLITHGNHNDIQKATILFDINHPDGHTYASFGLNWQIAIAAHEWGHNLDETHHPGTYCSAVTLMGENVDLTKKASDAWCSSWPGLAFGPTYADLNTVRCITYALCPAHNNFQSWMLNTSTILGTTGSTWEFAAGDYSPRLGRPEVLGVKKQTPSSYTEVHGLVGEATFQQWAVHTTTPLGLTNADWQFEFADWDSDGVLDLFAIFKAGSLGTEVHVYSGAAGPPWFSTGLDHITTALHRTDTAAGLGTWEFAVADWNGLGKPDLIGIKKQGGASSTEVHLYLGENDFGQIGSVHTATALGFTNSYWTFEAGDFNNDSRPDLFGIKMQGTGSLRTEVHILSGADNFTTFGSGNSWHYATPLGYTNIAYWAFAVADWERNGNVDLFIIKKVGASNTTEVYILSG